MLLFRRVRSDHCKLFICDLSHFNIAAVQSTAQRVNLAYMAKYKACKVVQKIRTSANGTQATTCNSSTHGARHPNSYREATTTHQHGHGIRSNRYKWHGIRPPRHKGKASKATATASDRPTCTKSREIYLYKYPQ